MRKTSYTANTFFRWNLVLLLGMLFFGARVSVAQPLPSHFHNRARIDTFLTDLKNYADSLHSAGSPQYVHIDTIGYSCGQQLNVQYPIYAVRVSTDADVVRDKAFSLIIGQIHGEEVIGLEVTLKFMWLLVHQSGRYLDLLDNTQMYFIPTLNPDGLEIVSRGWDRTYRKNGYVPPELNGRPCNIAPGPGWDSCGVDLNRNFELNWIYGDPLWYRPGSEPFDAYRGPSPASEPETQAVMALANRIKPTVSICYHSSRNGTGNEEKGIVAWKWGNAPFKYPPDQAVITNLNAAYCRLLHTSGGIEYTPREGTVHAGQSQDWFYWKLGCIQIITELGPGRNIQPDSAADLARYVADDLPSLQWMNERLNNFDGAGSTPLAIYTKDTSGNAISAEYRLMNTWTPLLAPWYTNEEFGRATILAPSGLVTIMARKEGYLPTTASVTVSPGSSTRSITLRLTPLPSRTLRIRLRDQAGLPIAGRVHFENEYSRWIEFSGDEATTSLPQGNYRVMFGAMNTGGKMVLWRYLNLIQDTTVEIRLPNSTLIWSEDFTQGSGNWTAGGTGTTFVTAPDASSQGLGTSLYTNSGIYGNNLNAWFACNQAFNLGSSNNVAYLEFWRRGRLDVPTDSVFLEISTNGGTNWQLAEGYCDQDIPWTITYVDLTRWAGQQIRLRFRISSDNCLGEFGYQLDNLKLYSGLDTAAPRPPVIPVYSYRITNAYPNPFNPSCTIAYEVAAPGVAKLAVYNILGEEVCRFEPNLARAGAHQWIWNGTNSHGENVVSGLYFVQLQAANTHTTQKLLLIR